MTNDILMWHWCVTIPPRIHRQKNKRHTKFNKQHTVDVWLRYIKKFVLNLKKSKFILTLNPFIK